MSYCLTRLTIALHAPRAPGDAGSDRKEARARRRRRRVVVACEPQQLTPRLSGARGARARVCLRAVQPVLNTDHRCYAFSVR